MSTTVAGFASAAPAPEAAWHATHVDPDAWSTHAATHAAAEHLEYFADVDATWHATLAEVKPLTPFANISMLIEPLLVLLPSLFSVWQDIIGFI